MRKRREEVDYGWDGGGDVYHHHAIHRWTDSTKDCTVIESGPSRLTIDDLERIEKEKKEWIPQGRTCSHSSTPTSASRPSSVRRRRKEVGEELSTISTIDPSRSTSQRRRRRRSTSRIPIFGTAIALALLPTAFAAPTRTSTHSLIPRQTTSSSTTAPDPQVTKPEPRIDEEQIDYNIKYLTSMSTPTHALPTDVYVVDERRLPFYMTQNEAGEWTKVDDAWFLYGRRAGDVSTASFSPGDDPSATAVPTTQVSDMSQFAIKDNLPPGWGIEATRSNFYITPLIVAMSVILALMIVAGIIFIVIKRRKQHRRAKRRAARLRRKALAAAGLTEDDINNDRGGDGIDSALRKKLDEIDKITKSKAPGAETKQRKERERGPTALIRTKVRSWNQGVGLLRRRKGGLGPTRSNTPSIEVIDDKEDELNGRLHGRGSSDTERTTPTVASHSSIDRAGTSGSGSGEATTSDTNETPSSSELSRTVTQPPPSTATYFPPAYRPASVRSLHVQQGASSSRSPDASGSSGPRSGPDDSGAAASPREKTNVPGYYPAPATEDSEVALAVASRSDGKRRMDVAPPDEEEEETNRIRHIATDDKQVLERMRMGASAPPQHVAGWGGSVDIDGQGGPSAPEVEVDEQGFERHDTAVLQVPPLPADQDGSNGGQGSSSPFPRPPSQRHRLSYRLYSQDDLAASLGVDERHLLPSAPPPAHPDHMTPSAPPFLANEDDADTAATPAPSAPAFDDNEGDEHNHSFSNDESGVDGGDEYARTDTNDTRESDDSVAPPHDHGEANAAGLGQEEEDRGLRENPSRSRNPSLPLYEP